MSELGRKLRQDATTTGHLADIADALEASGIEVEGFSPTSEWVIPGRCDMCGCVEEGGHCYCCNPVFGYGDTWHESRHPDGVKNAGKNGHPSIPLDVYVSENS